MNSCARARNSTWDIEGLAFTALFDSCVLYPAPIRDLLLRLALTDSFRGRWTQDIHEEWIGAVLRTRPDLTRVQLDRTRALMDAHVRDALITDYSGLIPGLSLPDPDDRHVLAAAIRGRVDVIVTYNLKDFPAAALDPYGIEAQHPDTFLAHLVDLVPGVVVNTVRTLRTALKNPPVDVTTYLQTLERLELLEFVAKIRAYEGVL